MQLEVIFVSMEDTITKTSSDIIISSIIIKLLKGFSD